MRRAQCAHGDEGRVRCAGTTIPGTGTVLKKAKIRGVESCGMLCSEREMGLSDEHEGIIELDADAPGGRALRASDGAGRPALRYRDHAQPRRLPRRPRHRPRPRGRRAGPAQGAAIEPVPGTYRSPIDVRLEFAGEEPLPCPLFLGATCAACATAKAPAGSRRGCARWPPPDLRPGRPHQLPHHRPQPPGARLRRGQGEGRHLAPPGRGRRALRRAQRQGVHARRFHVRHRRRKRRHQPRRRHGRRAHRLHHGDDRRLHRDRALRPGAHGRDRPRLRAGERRPLPLRARGRPGLRRLRHGADDAGS